MDKKTCQEVFDIAIEGIAQIWLKIPDMLQEQLDSETFFPTLIQTMLKDKKTKSSLYLQNNTKAQILRTLVKYLQLQENPQNTNQTKLVLQL